MVGSSAGAVTRRRLLGCIRRFRLRAQPLHIDAAPHRCIEFHSIHPSCVPQNTLGMLGGPRERSGFPPPSGDASHRRSVVYFCSAVLTLLRHAPGDSEFRKIGRKWLSGREDHRAWGFVWQRLFALDPGDTDLRKTGREWLDRNKTHPARKAVRRRLDKSHSEARSIGSSKTDISVLSGSSRASSAKAR